MSENLSRRKMLSILGLGAALGSEPWLLWTSDGISEDQGVKTHRSQRSPRAVEGCHEFARLGIDVDDVADVPVVDFFVVIIFDLHNLSQTSI